MTRVFVGGYLRSGTTLLQSVLCSSPQCNPMIGEVSFLRGIVESYGRSLELFDLHARYYFDDREQLRAYCAADVERFLAKTEARYGDPRHLVLKHPQLTLHFPLLHELLPEALFVVALRDPRDAVASAVTAQRKGAGEFGRAGPGQIAANLMRHYAACLACRGESFNRRTIYVKYEGLVRDTRTVVAALQGFTGIDLSGFDPDMSGLRSEWDFDEASERGRALHSEHYGKAISAARVGRYADVLAPADIQAIEQVCRPLLALYRNDQPVLAATPAAGSG